MSCGKFAVIFVLASALLPGQQAQEKTEFFESRVRPVLANKCFACHTENKLGGLRVDSRVALLQGGKSGPAIVPGRPEESLLIKAIQQADPALKMPMGGSKLKDNEITDLKYWIQAMAAFWPAEEAKPRGCRAGCRGREVYDPSGTAKLLVVPADSQTLVARREELRLCNDSYRQVHRGEARRKESEARSAGGQTSIDSPRVLRPRWPPSNARAGGRIPGR